MTTTAAVLAYTCDTAARQGWDAIDRDLLSALRPSSATLTGLVDGTGYSEPIVRDAVLGYLQGGYAVRVPSDTRRYELTLAGRVRLAQLTRQATAPALRRAA